MFKVEFFTTEAGNEPVRDWLRGLDQEERAVIGDDLRTVQFGYPIGMPLCRVLGDGLQEVRSNLPTKKIARLIFFQDGPILVVVGGFIKKTQKTPDNELKIARKRKEEYEKNMKPVQKPPTR